MGVFNREERMDFLRKIVHGLGQMLGPDCEVVLHDLSSPESSIVAIENGHVTDRKIGDPSTNLGLPIFKHPIGEYDQFNYRTQTRSGKTLKSSSLYFKDDEGRVFAALCLNWDISVLLAAANVLKDLAATQEAVDETFASDINDVISKILDDTLASVNKPIATMDKEDKLKIIQTLDEKGVFTVKRSVDRVAALLGISRVTVYGYLNEVQALKYNKFV